LKNWKKPKLSNTSRIINNFLRLQKVNDEYLEKKVEYGREIALSQQQVFFQNVLAYLKNEFLNKKIEELQRQVDEIIKRYEEKLSNISII
jgi:hypothetical protein